MRALILLVLVSCGVANGDNKYEIICLNGINYYESEASLSPVYEIYQGGWAAPKTRLQRCDHLGG